MQTFLAITGLVNSCASLILGFLVLAKDRKKTVHRLYFLLSVSISTWSIGYFFWMMQFSNGELALFWARILTIGSIFIPIFHMHWLAIYLDVEKKSRYMVLYSYAQGIFFLCFSFSPLMVRGVEPFGDIFTFWPKPGAMYFYYLLNFLISISYSTYLLISQYKKSQGMQKLKIRYLLFASLIAYVSGCSNFPLWYGVVVIPLANVLFVLFPLIIAYLIIKHHFMDIRLVLKKSTILLASVGTILFYLISVRYLSFKLFSYVGFWIDTLLVLTSIAIYPTIKNFFSKLANKYFFSSLYDIQELVSNLNNKISSTLNINDIYKHINESFFSAFYPKNFALFLYENHKRRFSLEYSSGLDLKNQKELQQKINSLVGVMGQQKIIFIDDMVLSTNNEMKIIFQDLNKMNIALLLPFYFEEKIMGVLALGDKETREIYNDEDLAVFNIMSAQIAISIKNALLHKDSLIYAENLNTEKNKIFSILANFIDPIIFIDKNKYLRIFNPAAQTVFGIRKTDTGKNIERINYKTNELKSIITAKSEKMQREIFIEQNGNQKYFKALSAEVLNDKKESIGTLKIFYDLTKEKELDKSKSEFISIAAHQLRTPLSSIKWIFELLINNEAGKINSGQRHYLEMGYISNEKLITIANDLLNVSKIEGGNLKLNLSNCDIKKILSEAKANITNIIKRKSIDLQYELAENLPTIVADESKISMVIENILNNAVNYTPNNGKINVNAVVEGNFLIINVTDSGIGIPEKEKKKIFSKFFRASNAVKAHPDGSGLGLFIAKNILQIHQGDMTFESQEGKGTKVIIKLPIAKS